MSRCGVEDEVARAARYCRAARRVRATYRGQTGRMYRELKALGAGGRGGRESGPTLRCGPGVSAFEGTRAVVGARAAAFAAEVEARLEGPVLRYSQRRRLLRAAARAGVGRFEANLIIAAVQHRRRGAGREPPGARDGRGRDVQHETWGLWCAGLAVAVQGAIAWGAWRIWWG